MIEINLIPDVKRELLKAQRARSIVISASILTSIIALGVVVLLLVYIYGVQAVRGSYLDGQITSKGQELAKIDDLSKILTIQNQLSTISDLNGRKVMGARVFDVISAITPRNATPSFSQITVTPTDVEVAGSGGQMRLEGQVASYDFLEIIKKTVANTSFQYDVDDQTMLIPLAENISTADISYGEDSNGEKVLRFTLSFDYPGELFAAATPSSMKFKLTTNGNVTDSYIGIPKFSERAKDIEGEE